MLAQVGTAANYEDADNPTLDRRETEAHTRGVSLGLKVPAESQNRQARALSERLANEVAASEKRPLPFPNVWDAIDPTKGLPALHRLKAVGLGARLKAPEARHECHLIL